MNKLQDLLETHVNDGSLPGAVALVARQDEVEVAVAGVLDLTGAEPMPRDALFRVASVTKPVTAVAVMMLVEDGWIALDDPVDRWLPELSSPSVVRTPISPVDDVVPAFRAITLFDLLTSRAGYGFPSDFSLPAVAPLFGELKQGLQPQAVAPPDEWMSILSRIPLLRQPGEAWLYNTCSDILGVLVARVTGISFADFLAERVFEPLGMRDTGFAATDGQLDRLPSLYRAGQSGELELVDAADGQWSRVPPFPSGAGGLVSTVDDLYAFARMLLTGGMADGGRLLSPGSIRRLTTNYLTEAQRGDSLLFLEGQGWGFGGSVDVRAIDPWNVPGRYGWVGGTGTALHVVPTTGVVTILLTQREMAGPTPPPLMREFWVCGT